MKKIVLSIVLIAFFAVYVKAQDETVVQLYVSQKQYEKAKDQVDKWASDPKLKDKDKPNAYLWKYLVYAHLYSDSALSPKYPNAEQEAWSAYNAYQAIDPSLKQLREQHFEEGLQNLDQGYVTKGNNYWGQKQYDSAFKYFSQSYRIRSFLYNQKLAQLDSTTNITLITFIAVAAEQSKQYDSAAVYYSKLADMKVSGTDNEGIYKFLIVNAINKKDDVAAKKYLTIAKELYPNDNSVWTQYEMSNMTANVKLPDLYQNYLKDAAAGGMNEDKLIGYAEAFATNDQTQLQGLDSMQKLNIKLAAAQAYAKAFELHNEGLYAYNTGVIYYNVFSELDDRYHANSGDNAALKTARTNIAKQQVLYADTSSQWFEKAYPVLKNKTDRTRQETGALNNIVKWLANIYQWDREATKTVLNNKDYDKYDALYKKYDAEYNSYK